jgi:gluconolactonase
VNLPRRSFLAATGAAALAPAFSQTTRDWTNKQPTRYPDPDVISLDPRFDKYKIGNAVIERHHIGARWAEGCAWNGQGRFLVWSDIPNNCQYRWLEEDGHVTTFRTPSENSNGNTFDYEGRQISCQHRRRRVVRYEHDGSVTVIADAFQGKPLNSPNDAVVHPDGAIWFTDPTYGILGFYEGDQAKPELKQAVYRVDPKTKAIAIVSTQFDQPNGICFSPDYKKIYVADSGTPRDIQVADVVDGKTVRNQKRLSNMVTPKGAGGPDGIRCDEDGNVWVAAGWIGSGYDGVHVIAPDGVRIGQILLPEICANVCFGGAKRNRLFMAASQSLYSVYVNTRGAHIT